MYDCPVSIADVAEAFSLPLPGPGSASHYTVNCPFCDTDNRKGKEGHLDINTVKNTYRCVKCGSSGGALSFYCFLSGLADDRKNRAKAFEMLARGGSVIRPAHRSAPVRDSTETLAPAEVRDRTYSELLKHLKLSENHKLKLLGRGLGESQIESLEYRSAPAGNRSEICGSLISAGCRLDGVPGFYYHSGKWLFGTDCETGILIPFRDCDGKIQGLQKRYDRAGRGKYRWISSKDMERGTGACSWVHISGNADCRTAIITEGGLKADVIRCLSSPPVTVIAVPGAGSTKYLAGVLGKMKAEGHLEKVYTAFDMDFETNPSVRKAYESLLELLRSLNMPYSVLLWDAGYKGLDDYLNSGSSGRGLAAVKGRHFDFSHGFEIK